MIYLDTNATAQPSAAALAAVYRQAALSGNASSLHRPGQAARRVLEDARATLRVALGAPEAEVVFTSGGTEADHLGVLGLARARRRTHGCKTVWISELEHPAVQAAAQQLEREGFVLQRFAIRGNGQIDPEFEPTSEVALAAVMLAHNETGVVQPVNEVVARAGQAGIPVHTDAVQAVGKLAISFDALGVASLALAAHKFGGPRGVGALLLRRRTAVDAVWRGGAQQEGRRPGTEPTALVAGMVAALAALGEPAALALMRDRIETRLLELPGSTVIGAGAPRLANTSAMMFEGVPGVALARAVAADNVAIGLGAACHGERPSPALQAMGFDVERAAFVVRLSVGWHNTIAEIDAAADRLERAVLQLRRTA